MMYEAPTTTAFRLLTQSPLGDVRTAWEMIALQDNPAATTMRRRTKAYVASDIVLRRIGVNLNMLKAHGRRTRSPSRRSTDPLVLRLDMKVTWVFIDYKHYEIYRVFSVKCARALSRRRTFRELCASSCGITNKKGKIWEKYVVQTFEPESATPAMAPKKKNLQCESMS